MCKKFTVKIPTSAYIKVYIESQFGSPVPINNKNIIGIYLVGLLEKNNFRIAMNPKEKNLRFQKLKENIKCEAPISVMKDIGWHLREDHIIQINRFFEEHFEHELYMFVKRNTIPGSRYLGYKQAIHLFANEKNIEIEKHISYEGLKKMEYVYRKRIKKNFVESSPQQ